MVQRGATASELLETGCPGQPASVLGLASKEKVCKACKHSVHVSCWFNFDSIDFIVLQGLSSYHPVALFSSLVHSFILPSFLLSQTAVIEAICLIQDMSYPNSKACDAGLALDLLHGLWGPLHRMADALRSLPRSCFFPLMSDLPVLSVLL